MDSLFPPLDPDPTPSGERRSLVPFRAVLPNLVTLLALCAGLTSMPMALEGRFELAVAAIVFAALLDGVDGRVARLLKSASRFGAELDSLTDFVNFGVAPAFLLYVWTLNQLSSFGWIAALILAICAALRLARFNAALDDPHTPDWHKDFFVGVPAPAGALTVLLPLHLAMVGVPVPEDSAFLVALYVIAIALLMVSRFPTLSGKRFGNRIPREAVLPVLVASVLLIALLTSYPFAVLALGSLAYLAHLPFAWRAWNRKAASGTVENAS